jgi:hypothetical protein
MLSEPCKATLRIQKKKSSTDVPHVFNGLIHLTYQRRSSPPPADLLTAVTTGKSFPCRQIGRTSRRTTCRTCLAPSRVRCQLAEHKPNTLLDYPAGQRARRDVAYMLSPTLPTHTDEAMRRLVLARSTSERHGHRHQSAGHDCHQCTM